MLLFFVLPVIGLVYALWHIWHILPLSVSAKAIVEIMSVVAFSCLFYYIFVGLDALPLWFARCIYNVGSSSLFILLYAVMLFLVLDVLRLTGLLTSSFLCVSKAGSIFVFAFIIALVYVVLSAETFFLSGATAYRYFLRI